MLRNFDPVFHGTASNDLLHFDYVEIAQVHPVKSMSSRYVAIIPTTNGFSRVTTTQLRLPLMRLWTGAPHSASPNRL